MTFTPGPWRWEVNLKSKSISLNGGVPPFDLQVMDFVRWGMNSAAPRLLQRWDKSGLMVMEHAARFAEPVPGREHHSGWFRSLGHPDARLIAAAPDLLDALNGLVGLIDLVACRSDLPGDLIATMKANHRYAEAIATIAKAEGV